MQYHTSVILASVILIANCSTSVMAASTKHPTHKSAEFTPAQKTKLMEEARKICRKQYGAMSTVYQLDYYHWKVWCREN
jgi:hypothetical protein